MTGPARPGPASRHRAVHAEDVAAPDAGQSTVEFALVLPLLFAFVLLVVQAGLILRDQVLVVHAAREAARVAALGGDFGAGEAAATSATGLTGAMLDVTVTDQGDRVRASVRYPSRVVVPLLRTAFDSVTVEASVTMHDESSAPGGQP